MFSSASGAICGFAGGADGRQRLERGGGDGAELMRSNEALPVPESVMQGSNLGMQSTHLLRVDFAGLLGYAAREALLSQRPRSSDRGRRRAERVQGNPTLGLLHQSGENKYRTISQSLQENVRSLSRARDMPCGSSSARSVRQRLYPFGGVRRREGASAKALIDSVKTADRCIAIRPSRSSTRSNSPATIILRNDGFAGPANLVNIVQAILFT
jgi:hypothetical protein